MPAPNGWRAFGRLAVSMRCERFPFEKTYSLGFCRIADNRGREKVTTSAFTPPPRFLARHGLEGFNCIRRYDRYRDVNAPFLTEPASSPSVIAKELCTASGLECCQICWEHRC